MFKINNKDTRTTPIVSFCQYDVKASGLQLSFNIFQWPSIWATIETNCRKPWIIGPDIAQL